MSFLREINKLQSPWPWDGSVSVLVGLFFLPELQLCSLRPYFVLSYVSFLGEEPSYDTSSALLSSFRLCFALCFHSLLLQCFSNYDRFWEDVKTPCAIPLLPFFLCSMGFCHLWFHIESSDQNINMLISEPWAIFLTVAKEHSPTGCALKLL